MCGVNGIISFNEQKPNKIVSGLKKMVSATEHRGPDLTETKHLKHAALGYQRLAIVSPNSHSGIWKSDDHSKFTMLNGEIVNHRRLKQQLNLPEDMSDSGLVLPLVQEYGHKRFVDHIHGMFAIIHYDEQKREVHLTRDQLGVKPLYYYFKNGLLIFSSEIKAIVSYLDEMPELRFSSIDSILTHRFNPDRQTVHKDIYRVLPGEQVVFNKNGISRRLYWQRRKNVKESNDEIDAAAQDIGQVFTKVMDENIDSDAPGGFFTSGGLDSSLTTSMALNNSRNINYRTPITLSFLPTQVEDERYCRILESYFGLEFSWITITDDLARTTLEKLVPFLDEPLENPTHIGTYLMAERAKELGVKSVITGDGSDEIFVGYSRHQAWVDNISTSRTPPKLSVTFTEETKKSIYKDGVSDLLVPITDNEDQEIFPIINIDQALEFERGYRLPEYHNMRVDRMTMAHGVEAKVPFMDSRLVDATSNYSSAFHHGIDGKQILKRIAEPYLPKELIYRKKDIFPSQTNQWTRGDGKQWSQDILLNPSAKISQWVDQSKLEMQLKKHYDNSTSLGREIWALVTLELWLQNISN